jgi:hypothetical protein
MMEESDHSDDVKQSMFSEISCIGSRVENVELLETPHRRLKYGSFYLKGSAKEGLRVRGKPLISSQETPLSNEIIIRTS